MINTDIYLLIYKCYLLIGYKKKHQQFWKEVKEYLTSQAIKGSINVKEL